MRKTCKFVPKFKSYSIVCLPVFPRPCRLKYRRGLAWCTSQWRDLKKGRAQHCFLELQLLPLYGSAAVPNVKNCPLMELQLSLDGTKAVLNAKDYPFIGTAAVQNIQDYPFIEL